jgi:hypothetical protein
VFDVDGLAEDTESTLVLQSVDGRGLDRVADHARWSSLAVAEIGAQTASALAHAHAHGVVHGDIGPASVVVGGTGAAPFAWLTGFTAGLHPDRVSVPGDTTAATEPADDVAALGRVLALALDPDAFAATTLEQALAAMGGPGASAAGAAESLGRIAESLHAADEDETGLVPLVALPPDPSPTIVRAVGPAAVPDGGSHLIGAGVGGALTEAPLSRPARLAGRGLQVAALGGVTLALAVASGFVLWASEGPAGETPRPTGLPTAPVPALVPTVPLAPTAGADDSPVEERTTRRTSRTPITSDVTTTTTRPAPVVPPPPVPTTRPTRVTPPEPDPPTTTATRRTTTRAAGQNATLAAP